MTSLQMTTRIMRALLWCVASVGLSAGCLSRPNTRDAPPAPSLSAEYAELSRRVIKLNRQSSHFNRFSMNSEHALLMDDEDAKYLDCPDVDLSELLRGKVVTFLRRSGALDYIFARLLTGTPDDEEVLAASHMLIYAGEHYERPDEVLPPSKLAPEMLAATETGRFRSAEARWPEAPVREKIANAAKRSLVQNNTDPS